MLLTTDLQFTEPLPQPSFCRFCKTIFLLVFTYFYFSLVSHHYTVSIALPGSIIDNAQSQELKAYLAGQVIVPVVCSCEFLFIDSESSGSV